MAKKWILLITVFVMIITVIGFSIDALDIGIGDDFKELTTDKSFMLDSPLFTHKGEETATPELEEALENARNSMFNKKLFNFEKVLQNDNFELYINTKEDEADSPKGAIRIINLKTGYVWASDLNNLDNLGDVKTNALINSLNAFEVSIRKDDNNPGGFSSDKTSMTYTVNQSNKTITYNVNYVALNTITDVEMKLSFQYIVTLTDDGINLKLPVESIKEENCKMMSITFYRLFGNFSYPKETNPVKRYGYIVIPSGNGGLIRYNQTSPISSIYSNAFYGKDQNYVSDKSNNLLSMPMYGMVHGENNDACLVSIKSGSQNAMFNYAPPGQTNSYGQHLSYLSFNLRQIVSLQLAGTGLIQMTADKPYESDIEVSYSFLNGMDANYVGIANKYQEQLVAEGNLVKQDLASEPTMHVETFGREYENGLIMKKYHNMTTTSDVLLIDDYLKAGGVDNVLYTLKGYYRGGYSASNPTKVKFESRLGDLDDLENLDYYMYYNPAVTYNSRLTYPSYVMVNTSRLKAYTMLSDGAKYQFYTEVPTMFEGTKEVIDRYASKVSFDGITNYLYGDFNNDYDREDTYQEISSFFAENSYPMYAPNAYLFKNTSEYLTMDLYHERLTAITDSIPLTQIILRGYMDLYSTYLNFSTNPELDVLKCIEYGVYPAYLVTYEPSHLLSNTLSNNLYASEFGLINNQMINQYQLIKNALHEVVGATIIAREVLDLGIVAVSYSNNVAIVVNYTNNDYVLGDKTIKSMGYEVIK